MLFRSAANAGHLLARLGMPDTLRGGKGQITGQLHWSGSPAAPHYPSLGGHLRLDMGEGQFLKADPGAAKLLGVLSLQALPRRLTLDFRDLFTKAVCGLRLAAHFDPHFRPLRPDFEQVLRRRGLVFAPLFIA